MKLLVLGYSDFVRRRVLPALARLGAREVDVASRTRTSRIAWPAGLAGEAFADHHEALRRSDAEVVYLSTVNAAHEELAEAALERGSHVIVDKPAFVGLAAARRLVTLAAARRRGLAEATVYGHHPRLRAALRCFAAAAPTRLSAVFCFPPVADDNFRYRADLGGGALADLGPYAVTPGRLFFGAPPDSVVCRIGERRGAVETAFSVLMTYPGGRVMVGHYGMTGAYVHRLDISGPDVAVGLERAFAPPPDLATELIVERGGRREVIAAPPADSVALFLADVLAAFARGDLTPWREALLADAVALDRLRCAAC